MKKKIESENAPKAIGPYSQAIKIKEMVFTSGQIPIDHKTGEMIEKNIEKQTKKVMENLKAVLEEANTDFENVIKTTIFLQDLNNFSKVNEIYGSYFKGTSPARSTVEVSNLPKDSMVEIEMIAFCK